MKSAPKETKGGQGSQPPTKRMRTDEQLDRKRQTDREKHRANRAESKTQLSNIELNVVQVRAQLDLLLSKIDSLSEASSGHASSSHAASSYTTPSESTSRHRLSVGERRELEVGSVWTDAQSSAAGTSPSKSIPSVPVSLPQLPIMPMAPITCRCGITHKSAADCPAYAGVALLYQAHVAIASNPNMITELPRSPTIANYMLMDDGHVLSKSLTHSIRQFRTKNVQTLWAVIFVVYRLFRWRLCPTKETEVDMPVFMKPTEIQQTTVHPVIIDCLPWPKIRDHLCLNLVNEEAHSTQLYVDSFELLWPSDKPLLVRDEDGNVTIHPEFEDHAGNLANWHLGSPWREACPELHHLVLE